MQTNAIVINDYGDTNVMQWAPVELPALGEHDVLIENKAIGFNMIDTYFRKGLYPAELPFVLGAESAGVVLETGASVSHVAVGDRVACVQPKAGAYAEHRVVSEENLVKVPEGVDDKTAAAGLLKGMTAQFLLKQTYPIQTNDTIVVYAASGGVGSILVQWAKHLKARVIAVTGTAEKCELATSHGADLTIDMSAVSIADIPKIVKDYTKGAGVPVVYDSLGKDTFLASLDCLRSRGLMVSYGNATGAVDGFSLLELAKRGSLYLTRPTLFSYVDTQESLAATAADVFDAIQKGIIKINIGQSYDLENAAEAHKAAESRQTTGSTILLP